MAEDAEALPPAAQAAAVRQMLTDDPALTLEGLETAYPHLAEGVKLVLKEGPKPARSGSGPMENTSLADVV